MKQFIVVLIWFPAVVTTLIFSMNMVYQTHRKYEVYAQSDISLSKSISRAPYQLYASLPKVLGTNTFNVDTIKANDAVPELVRSYLKKYKSPMLESSDALVSTARKYDLDPLLLVSIAQCESNLGKKMPDNCHNPFGWGIHSRGTLCFDTWEEGYEAVAKGLRDKYFNIGMENPDDIMNKYTPAALEKGGSWAKCVNHFMEKLNTEKEGF